MEEEVEGMVEKVEVRRVRRRGRLGGRIVRVLEWRWGSREMEFGR